MPNMRTFYQVITNNLLAILANSFVWFALSFWAYIETNSVMTAAIFNGAFVIGTSLLAMWLGSMVDHHKKKTVMMGSSLITLIFLILAGIFYHFSPQDQFQNINQSTIWIYMSLNLIAILAGNIRNIATPTLVSLLVPENKRDKMNGLSGVIFGVSGSAAGIFSGLTLAYSTMFTAQLIGIALTLITIIHLLFTTVNEPETIFNTPAEKAKNKKIDIKGTLKIMSQIPGLFALILYSTFNNLLSGVYLALLDPYGIELTSVRDWGILWGFLSTGFIFGGLFIAKYGLGKNPVKKLFLINIILWINCMIFPLKDSVILLSIGILSWTILMPYLEATEQTIVQKVVPYKRQGRVFGLAQSIESSASPLTALIIAPIANFLIIPSMTSGRLAELIGPYFGTGTSRGIALIFIIAAILGLIMTLIAMRSKNYLLLSQNFQEDKNSN